MQTESGYRLPAKYDQLAVTFNKINETKETIQLTERQQLIYDTIRKICEVTATELADTLADTLADMLPISKRTIEREISFLKKNAYIRKEGKRNKGVWVILK